MTLRAAAFSLCFFTFSFAMSACVKCDPTLELCAEEGAPTCIESVEKRLEPGPTGVAECRSGTCGGSSLSCSVASDCIVPLSGEVIAWQRPQGGLGSRFNTTLYGFPAFQEPYLELQTIIIQTQRDSEGQTVTEETLCNTNEGYTFDALPDGDQVCQRLIADEVNGTFPVICRADNVVAVEEDAIRFQNQWTLEDLDGAEVDVYTRVQMRDGTEVSGQAEVTLRVGDFVEPSWWDEQFVGQRN